MMNGAISANREAVLKLTVYTVDGQPREIEAAIDTGFNDFLTLRPEQIAEFGLTRRATIRASLGDGSIVSLPVYTAIILWHEQSRSVDVLQNRE